VGGAHRGREQVLAATEEALSRSLRAFGAMAPDALKQQRRDKFLAIGRDL
jgi:acetyl-CoA carboxylase carboxyl transferase subunit alpha